MSLFLFLDAARVGQLFQEATSHKIEYLCLYEGRERNELGEVAPYLFEAGDNEEFLQWFMEEGWGKSWGYFVKTEGSFLECVDHWRKFLVVRNEEGKDEYFRFYDPRVLKGYLPTRDTKYVQRFFGPADYFIVEGEKREEAILFRQNDGVLEQLTIEGGIDQIGNESKLA